jgi:hypothetical protein
MTFYFDVPILMAAGFFFLAMVLLIDGTRHAQQNLLRMNGSDVLQPGDPMSVWLDSATHKLRKVEIETTLEKKSVKVVSDFLDLPNGPAYMGRSTIHYPSHQITITTETSTNEPRNRLRAIPRLS